MRSGDYFFAVKTFGITQSLSYSVKLLSNNMNASTASVFCGQNTIMKRQMSSFRYLITPWNDMLIKQQLTTDTSD